MVIFQQEHDHEPVWHMLCTVTRYCFVIGKFESISIWTNVNLELISPWRRHPWHHVSPQLDNGSSLGLNQDNKFHVVNMGPPGSCRPQVGPILTTWTLLSGLLTAHWSAAGSSSHFRAFWVTFLKKVCAATRKIVLPKSSLSFCKMIINKNTRRIQNWQKKMTRRFVESYPMNDSIIEKYFLQLIKMRHWQKWTRYRIHTTSIKGHVKVIVFYRYFNSRCCINLLHCRYCHNGFALPFGKKNTLVL